MTAATGARSTSRLASRFAPSLSTLWVFLAVALPVLAALLAPMPSVDLAYQLRAGGEILDSRAIPTVDTWTLAAAGRPWTDQQWGAQVLLAVVYRLAGWTGLAVLRAALVGVTCWLLLVLARRRAPRLGPMGATLLVLGAFAVMAIALALRPQLFAIPLFVVVLLLLADRDAHPRRLWWIPVVAALWANLHGSFPLVLVVLGISLFAEVLDRRSLAAPSTRLLGVVTLASVAATLVNPFGLGVWTYLVSLATNPTISSRVSEWRPPTPLDPSGALFYLSVLAVVALLVVRRRRGLRLPGAAGLATLAAFGLLAAYTGRGLAWWPPAALFVIAPIVADQFALARLTSSVRPSRLNGAVIAVMLVAGIALLPVWRPVGPAGVPLGTLSYAPQGIAAYLWSQHFPARTNRPGSSEAPKQVWAPQVWGSWLELDPNTKVAVDSRIELVPTDFWAQYDEVESGGPLWNGWLENNSVEFVVTAHDTNVALEEALGASGRWRVVYSDDDGSVWQRGG
ncbi:MAG TPA: hypothetical protein VF484_07175 [Candidatus Limnocylindrales bacterium]